MLDPGLAFGTGTHPTTALCLEWLERQQLNGQCVLEDHSRYGTFLNGHRIDGSTVLQVGDTVRVGSPGYEFQMITTDETYGA